MKTLSHFLKSAGAASLLVLQLCGCGKPAAPAGGAVTRPAGVSTNETGKAETTWETNSVFEANLKSARDPFFPETAPAAAAPATAPAVAAKPKIAAIRLRGISGAPGHRLALINNQVFAEGEQAKVRLGEGVQVVVRCVEIGERAAKVLVEGDPTVKELQLSSGL